MSFHTPETRTDGAVTSFQSPETLWKIGKGLRLSLEPEVAVGAAGRNGGANRQTNELQGTT